MIAKAILSSFLTFIIELWDNCFQNFHLGRYIIEYTVGILFSGDALAEQ